MRVLVTGATGFIGSHVLNLLDDPVGFDHRHSAHIRYPETSWIFGDIRDANQVTEAVAHVEAVIHLAGVLGTQETIGNPRPATDTNISGGLNVLEACTQYSVPLVYIAVGNHWMDNPYSISKTTVERFCRMYRQERGLNVSIVRAMNAYGPGQVPAAPFGPSKVRKFIPSFICRALTGQPIEIYGDGKQVADAVHVDDAASVLVRALGLNQDFDCGTGRATTVNEIAEEVAAHCPTEIVHLPMRAGEPENAVVIADPEKMLQPATVSLEDGIASTVEWYRENWLPQWR
jgi:UDP-glucose 4-epimerase